MIHRRHGAMRFEKLLWITKAPPKRVGLYLINTTLPRESGIDACISSRITTGIQVVRDYQRNYNWYNEPFAVFKVKELYLDMHGLIFETSVWLLAESTRLLSLSPWSTGHDDTNKWSEPGTDVTTPVLVHAEASAVSGSSWRHRGQSRVFSFKLVSHFAT